MNPCPDESTCIPLAQLHEALGAAAMERSVARHQLAKAVEREEALRTALRQCVAACRYADRWAIGEPVALVCSAAAQAAEAMLGEGAK